MVNKTIQFKRNGVIWSSKSEAKNKFLERINNLDSGFTYHDGEQFLVSYWENDKITTLTALVRVNSGTPMVTFSDDMVSTNNGIPIMNEEMVSSASSLPNEYLLLDDDILPSYLSDETSYVDIMFSALRQLQAEVARLRNSFLYGINSLTGTQTTMSDMLWNYNDSTDSEPLWAVDENSLSEISESINVSLIYNEKVNLKPNSAYTLNYNNCVSANSLVYWEDKLSDDGSYYIVKNVNDSKLYVFITCNKLNQQFTLEDLDNSDNKLLFNLQSLDISKQGKYNIMLIISRKTYDKEDEKWYGDNYLWLEIADYNANKTLANGYVVFNSDGSIKLSDTKHTIESRYYFKKIEYLNACNIYKTNFYSKLQDFSNEIIPTKPDDTSYKFSAAHITIRSVTDEDMLKEVSNYIENNELIYEEQKQQLWIKSNNELKKVGGGSSSGDTDTMTEKELYGYLSKMGIVSGASGLELSNVSNMEVGTITFVHTPTKKRFNFTVDENGGLQCSEVSSLKLQDTIDAVQNMDEYKFTDDFSIRGFASHYFCAKEKLTNSSYNLNSNSQGNIKINSDRVKIGSLYMPNYGDTIFGCSHGFIELENTSNKDFPLDKCYLHYLHEDINDDNKVKFTSLELDGKIPAGGTYLIRCKKYADKEIDGNVVIDVSSFDKEWYNGNELLDLTTNPSYPYGFVLMHGVSALTLDYKLYDYTPSASNGTTYCSELIDLLPINQTNTMTTKTGKDRWIIGSKSNQEIALKSNCIYKNTFELDPAQQAFQSLRINGTTITDASRGRLQSTDDFQYLLLNKKEISFPHSDETYNISNYTPMSSKLKKNVLTDKSKLDYNKPNMVTCSFGINMLTTRCFNWISTNNEKQYVWLYSDEDLTNLIGYYESYDTIDSVSGKLSSDDVLVNPTLSYPHRVNFYDSYSGTNGTYYVDEENINNTVYAKINGRFPGSQEFYSSRKCIINVVESAVTSPTVYYYTVGPANNTLKKPDLTKCSDVQSFTLYPSSYTPRIYQTTDQQGFHWIEYQVWAGAANAINNRIVSDCSSENIIPVLINTGDMTQNGTRYNEWLDYYNAGKSLFSHIEQMNVVGNNDLCGSDVTALGTGDDDGKSNGYYFHVFYCYEVEKTSINGTKKTFAPIVNGKYIPSLYHFGTDKYDFLMVNSEITETNCKNWFKTINGDDIYNIYTGWKIDANLKPNSDINGNYDNSFVSIYTMLYHILNNNKNSNKNTIVACHEMPFTVITSDGLKWASSANTRSIQDNKLIGSHLNQISVKNVGKGLYWFSRLLEYFKVNLCIGGHKHTYALTYPLLENYYKNSDGSLNSKNSNAVMGDTLSGDTCYWSTANEVNFTKLPMAFNVDDRLNTGITSDYFSGLTKITKEDVSGRTELFKDGEIVYSGVTYFMCQATGFKLKSNKELPSNNQIFSRIIPQTAGTKPANNQQLPMFGVIDVNGSKFAIKLVRVNGIMSGEGKILTQSEFSKNNMSFDYGKMKVDSRYPDFVTEETPLISYI